MLKRLLSVGSIASLIVTAFVAQPASAAGTSPAWDTGASNGGVPLVTISSDIVTVVSIPDLAVPNGWRILYACDQAVSAGFYSWSAPIGQPIYPPSDAINGATCVEIAFGVSTGSTYDLLSLRTNGSGPSYDPATHGTNIVAGWRQSDAAGAGNADDLMWAALGDSVVYTPPAPPTVTSQPILSLTGTAISFTGAVFSGGTGSAENRIYSCPGPVTAVTVPSAFSALGLSGCARLQASSASSAAPTNLSTAGTTVYVNGVPTYRAYDAAAHGSHIVGYSTKSSIAVVTASIQIGGNSPAQVAPAPYTGPVVTPSPAVSFRPGGKAVLPGSNLSGVSKVSVAGLDANVKVNSAGELEITVPSSLKPGVYDLVIVSDSGTLTVQDGLRISAPVVLGSDSPVIPSTRLKEDGTVKVYVDDVVGAGKVQIFHNGKEIAWVNAADNTDPKLRLSDGVPYLVRNVNLVLNMKNVVEIHVDGERVKRVAYSG